LATVLEYALLADAAYQAGSGSSLKPPESWTLVETSTGVGGFKGAAFARGGELVVAFAGTEIKSGVVDAIQDVTADLRILGDMPRQSSAARDLFKAAQEHSLGQHCGTTTICGHSLGGALTQHIAYWTKENFVTFNAPGAYTGIQGTKLAFFHSPQKAFRTWEASFRSAATGYNYRLPNDPISKVGIHYGSHTITMDNDLGKSGHSMVSVIEVCRKTIWGSRRPFGR
jgi:pimeloyl-ACP methyl ester carboxylesterase